MKGLVFVELLKMAEASFGEDKVDAVMETVSLPSGGVYTSVGYYDCAELVTLVDAFSRLSGIPRTELERKFGHWVMKAFRVGYPDMFEKHGSAFDMLEAIEDDIHVEVRKLYPDAELPSFSTIRDGSAELTLEYRSTRPLAHFCHGLIENCFAQYGERADIEMNDQSRDDFGRADFHISKNAVRDHE